MGGEEGDSGRRGGRKSGRREGREWEERREIVGGEEGERVEGEEGESGRRGGR